MRFELARDGVREWPERDEAQHRRRLLGVDVDRHAIVRAAGAGANVEVRRAAPAGDGPRLEHAIVRDAHAPGSAVRSSVIDDQPVASLAQMVDGDAQHLRRAGFGLRAVVVQDDDGAVAGATRDVAVDALGARVERPVAAVDRPQDRAVAKLGGDAAHARIAIAGGWAPQRARGAAGHRADRRVGGFEVGTHLGVAGLRQIEDAMSMTGDLVAGVGNRAQLIGVPLGPPAHDEEGGSIVALGQRRRGSRAPACSRRRR